MPWIAIGGKVIDDGAEDSMAREFVTWRKTHRDDSPVAKGVEVDEFVFHPKARIVEPETFEEAVKMATMDIKLDVSDFKKTIEEFQEFIHSELETIEARYSESNGKTDALAIEMGHLSANLRFIITTLEDKLDKEVADRMELAIRMEREVRELNERLWTVSEFMDEIRNMRGEM